MENKTPINNELLDNELKHAHKKQLESCKNTNKWSRAMLRAELEEHDMVNQNVNLLTQINTKLSQIGQPAIAYYFEVMREKIIAEKREKEEQEKTNIDNNLQ